ncbi:unnamed protein product, partial [Tenebrio molitor]
LDPEDVSLDSLKVLWYCRLHPALKSRWIIAFAFINCSLLCLYLVLAIKGVLVSYNTDLFFMAECLQTCLLMLHATGKLLFFQIHKNAIEKLLKQKSKFWKIKDFDGKIQKQCTKIYYVGKMIIRYYFWLVLCGCLFFDVQPFTTGTLPSRCYVPEGCFTSLTVVLWYLSYVAGTCIPVTDGIFCSLGVSLIVQFKLLSQKFKNMNFVKNKMKTKMRNELKQLVDYHNFLLSYCEELNTTFRGVFLIQFLISIASASISVFIFMQPGPWSNRVKFLIYFFLIMIQTAFYCIPMELTVNAASRVADAIYTSQWYEINVNELKKCLVIILIRTQKAIIFSGYGIIYINLQTFVVICKTTFTFFTYLNSAKVKH